jgi:two-component system, sensor histidine kinase
MKSRLPGAGPRAEPNREMLIELLRLHAQALRRMPWIQTCLVLGIALLMHAYIRPAVLLGWAVLTISVETLRAQYAKRVLKRGHDINPTRTHVTFAALAALAGAATAASAVLFLPLLPLTLQCLLGVVLLAIPAAGTAVAQSSPYTLAAYALSLLVPASLTWAYVHPEQALPVAALTLLYCVVLIMVTADGEKLLARSVMIRHERDRLVRDLERRNADVRVAMGQAEQSAQARARVLAAASHDLRQPLHALSVYSAVLASKPAPDLLSEVSQNIDQIVRALGNLLNGLLDLSRLSAGNYVPEHQKLSLERLIGGVCAEYQQAAAQKGLALIQELSDVRVVGDSVAIGRIARNLIDNAIKYTERGQIRVVTRCEYLGEAPLAILSVTDTGRGIPPSEQSRIFEEFYQLDNPGRDRNKGVGLGLAIVQRLCELTGAKISVESTVGQGTSFRLAMPALLESAATPEPAAPATAEVSLQGKRVYVVDDEHDILHSMRTLLGVWGMQTLTADSATAADRIFEQHGAPDLLLMDLRLGDDVHGARLAERLQREHGRFPILIITGETASEALKEAVDRNYTVLRKPIAAEVLRRAIAATVTA